MRRIYIITGICGHLGNTLSGLLISQGKEVRGLALPNESSDMLHSSIRITRGNVCDIDSMEPLFDGITPEDETVFIHAAGIISISKMNEDLLYSVNVGGTKNVIELCKRHNVNKLVYVSSVHAIPELEDGSVMGEVYDFDPDRVHGGYSRSKAMATAAVLEAGKNGLNVTVVHPSGIIGPGDYSHGLMGQLIKNYINGTITSCIRGGYDFVDVRDVAAGIAAAADRGRPGECYILSNRYYSALEILNIVHDITGRRQIKVILPLWFVKSVTPLAELYFRIRHEKPLFTKDSLTILNSNASFSHEKAERELAYTTRDMRETVSDTVEFLKKSGCIKNKAANSRVRAAAPKRG